MNWTIKDYEDLRNLGLVLAAVIAVPLAGWRSLIAHKQAKIAAENHLAETYTKAIDQIGDDKETIQLGGLYALEKMARTNRQYHGQIIEVLCAFVRLHAPLSKADEKKIDGEEKEKLSPPKLIVQTAITIIGRRNSSFDTVSFIQENLNKLYDYLNKKFEKNWFQKFIPNSQIYSVTIDLKDTQLYEINLFGANFENANLWGANLENANLYKVNLRRAFLAEANFQNALLVRGDFSKANLTEAYLISARAMKVNLKGADLFGADLSEVNLEKAGLTEADLTKANLTGAKIYGANLTGAKLIFDQIRSAKFDENTRFPENFSKPFLNELIEKQKNELVKLII
jgi:uncharacterized protein YjbI with pentapeptide repeats